MAALQELVRALRDNFSGNTTAIQLSEILQFIEQHAKSKESEATEKATGKPQPNAKITREDTRQATQQQQQKAASYAEIAKRAREQEDE